MSEKLCLKWNEFQDNISKTFRNLRQDTYFSDVTLVCEDGKQIEAHKVILSASSNFFQKLLARIKHPHPLIYLRGVKSDDLLAIIDFLYFGEAKVYQEHLDSFLCLAKEVQLEGLMNQFDGGLPAFSAGEEFLLKNVTNLENSPTQEETPGNQKSSKEPEGVPSPFSGDVDDRVKSMIEKSKNHIGYACFACKVCGKKGYSSSIKNHIERIHLEGFIVFCNKCEKTFKSRNDLKRHQKTH